MITKISTQEISFKGQTLVAKEELKYLREYAKKFGGRSAHEPSTENYGTYANILNSSISLKKGEFSYKAPISTKLPIYQGPKNKEAGFSTESGCYGGGWLKSSISTPLSTSGIHECGLLNLIDEKNGEQVLYHVFNKTSALTISKFIREQLPKFNKVNIAPGDASGTSYTIDNILLAVNNVNPKAEKTFFHFSTPEPEVVAYKGSLSFMPNQKPEHVSFIEDCHYYNGIRT